MADLLAGYISGTSVDIARVRNNQAWVELYDQKRFVSRDFSNLESILKLYLKKNTRPISAACFGVAGPVLKNTVTTTNLPWYITGDDIEKQFSIGRVRLVNDIVATAYGLTHLSAERFFTINEGVHGPNGNLGLIAAGSGLGQALIYRDRNEVHPYASEGGHADFAPGNQLEMELWEYIYAEQGHVEAEDVITRGGLERIYYFLTETQGLKSSKKIEKAEDAPGVIIELALSGKDETATRTVRHVFDCLASESANLALKGMTTGGIYVGGLIAPQIITLLDGGRFMERFVKKGKMETILRNMPVGIIIEEKAALLVRAGSCWKWRSHAAAHYFSQRRLPSKVYRSVPTVMSRQGDDRGRRRASLL